MTSKDAFKLAKIYQKLLKDLPTEMPLFIYTPKHGIVDITTKEGLKWLKKLEKDAHNAL